MPVVEQRQPAWLWPSVGAAAAVLVFILAFMVTARPGRRDTREAVNVVQPSPPAVTEPVPSVTAPATPDLLTPPPVTTMPPAAVTMPPPAPAAPVEPTPATQTPKPGLIPQSVTKPAPHVKTPPAQIIKEKTIIVREKAPEPRTRVAGGLMEHRSPDDRAATRTPWPDEFRDSRLPKELQWDNGRWRAQNLRTIEDADTSLKLGGSLPDGTTFFVREDASEPYDAVLILIPGETDKYVEYQRR